MTEGKAPEEVHLVDPINSVDPVVEDTVMSEPSQEKVETDQIADESVKDDEQPSADNEDKEDVEEGDEESSSGEEMPSDLDEDDLDLLEHTLGRNKTKAGFSRLQRRLDSDEEPEEAHNDVKDEEEDSDEEEMIGMKRKGKSNLDKLFDDSDEEEVAKPSKDYAGDEDDLDDFIEDDMAEAEQDTRIKKVKAPTRKKTDYARFGSGLSRDVLQDLVDIFGDGTEYADMVDDDMLASDMDDLQLAEGRKSRSGKASPVPATPADVVREKDVPERYQSSGIVPLSPDGELEQEAVWISSKLLPFVHERMPDATADRLIPVVGAVVSLIRDSLLEIPFIATHRKEYFQHLLGLTDLWRILDFDEEWRTLSRQKASFASYMAAKEDPVDVPIDEAVQDIGDLEFYQEYYKQVIRFGTGPRSRTAKPIYGQLVPFVRSFALEPQNFLMNWANKEQRHQPASPIDEPGLAAVQFMSDEMPSETAILRDARSLASLELAFHPKSNRMFRSALEAVACVSVTPTALGQREIGMNHDLAGFKYLAEKPVASFIADGDLYLRLVKAEKAGLIQMSLVFRRMTELQAEWSEFYGATGEDDWAELRKKVLQEAIHDHLIPRVKRILQGRLTRQAEQFVAQGCQYALQAKLMQAPFNPGLSGIMAISWGDGSPQAATMCVRLDANGRVIDQARFVHLQEGLNRNRDEWERLYAFIHELQPALVVVGGTSVRTVELYDGLRSRFRHGDGPRVVFGEDDSARLYQDSPRAQVEFPEYGSLLRYCVSLGRRWINPLFELASAGDSLVKMPLHPSQAMITADLLARHVERALVNVANLVGLDANTLAPNPWARAPLRYIAGLGPLKAEQLTHQIQRRLSGRVETRSDLSALLGPIVFMNACSFLRVLPTKEGKEKHWPTEPLDTTRIHPENYPLARKIACDATEMTSESGEEEEEVGRRAVIAAMKQPERLNDLLLEEYARELEKRIQLPKHLTLLDIKAELQAPYADLRTAVDEAPAETVFESLTGETESSLYVGQQVQAKVLRVTDRSAICRLESGLTGHLTLKNLPVDPATGRVPSHPGRVLRPNQAVLAAVIDIHLTRFEVTLSLLPDDLKEPRRPRSGDFDPYYDHEAAKNLQKRRRGFTTDNTATSAATTSNAPQQRRQISHPCYKEVSRLEAERLLSSAVLGEVIVRPSGSHGAGHLAMTWKVDQCDQGGLYQHVDIEEKDRPKDAYGGLGRSLTISLPDGSRHTMGDLDELIARYVEPIASYLQDIRTCPKFLPINSLDKTGSRSAVEAWLAIERSKAPGRIAYCISLSRDKPGAALLSYQPSNRCHHELVDVLPTGFRLRGTSFEKLENLINWFKGNYNRR